MTGKIHKLNIGIVVLAVLTVGVLMVVFSEKKSTAPLSETDPLFDEVAYEERLEKRLKELITQIDGVGDVCVMVTLEGSATYNYATDVAKDTKADGDSKKESTVVLSAKGTNTKEAVISGYSLPDIKGAAVVCSKKITPTLQGKVIGVVSAALGIPTNKIYVTD